MFSKIYQWELWKLAFLHWRKKNSFTMINQEFNSFNRCGIIQFICCLGEFWQFVSFSNCSTLSKLSNVWVQSYLQCSQISLLMPVESALKSFVPDIGNLFLHWSHMLSSLLSINIANYIDQFLNVEPSLHSWDEPHFMVMSYIFILPTSFDF